MYRDPAPSLPAGGLGEVAGVNSRRPETQHGVFFPSPDHFDLAASGRGPESDVQDRSRVKIDIEFPDRRDPVRLAGGVAQQQSSGALFELPGCVVFPLPGTRFRKIVPHFCRGCRLYGQHDPQQEDDSSLPLVHFIAPCSFRHICNASKYRTDFTEMQEQGRRTGKILRRWRECLFVREGGAGIKKLSFRRGRRE